MMGLFSWLTDVFEPVVKLKKKNDILFSQARIQARMAATKFSEELQARSDQLWEDLMFRERYFNMRFAEKYAMLEHELKTGNKPNGTFGPPIYPPYTVWDPKTAKYIDNSLIDKEWEEYKKKYSKDIA